MSTKYEYANHRISAAERHFANSTILEVWGGKVQMPRSPSLLKLFSNGWNWDEVRHLKFIVDTYYGGIRLLQSFHFVVAPKKLQI